jgi:hypothetical protein
LRDIDRFRLFGTMCQVQDAIFCFLETKENICLTQFESGCRLSFNQRKKRNLQRQALGLKYPLGYFLRLRLHSRVGKSVGKFCVSRAPGCSPSSCQLSQVSVAHLLPRDPLRTPLSQVLPLRNQTLMDGTGEQGDAVPPDLVAEVLTGDTDA